MARDHAALHRWMAERSRMPFGGFDEFDCCARFAAGAVEAQTGADPLARLSVTWSTPAGARRALARAGGIDAATSKVLTECPVGFAQRGDVGFVPASGWANGALVIVEGDHLLGPAPGGLIRLPRSTMTRAWRAG